MIRRAGPGPSTPTLRWGCLHDVNSQQDERPSEPQAWASALGWPLGAGQGVAGPRAVSCPRRRRGCLVRAVAGPGLLGLLTLALHTSLLGAGGRGERGTPEATPYRPRGRASSLQPLCPCEPVPCAVPRFSRGEREAQRGGTCLEGPGYGPSLSPGPWGAPAWRGPGPGLGRSSFLSATPAACRL